MLINRNFYPYFRVPDNTYQVIKLGDGIMDPFWNHEHMTIQGVKVEQHLFPVKSTYDYQLLVGSLAIKGFRPSVQEIRG